MTSGFRMPTSVIARPLGPSLALALVLLLLPLSARAQVVERVVDATRSSSRPSAPCGSSASIRRKPFIPGDRLNRLAPKLRSSPRPWPRAGQCGSSTTWSAGTDMAARWAPQHGASYLTTSIPRRDPALKAQPGGDGGCGVKYRLDPDRPMEKVPMESVAVLDSSNLLMMNDLWLVLAWEVSSGLPRRPPCHDPTTRLLHTALHTRRYLR